MWLVSFVFYSLVPGLVASGVRAEGWCTAVCVQDPMFGKWLTAKQPGLPTCGQMT